MEEKILKMMIDSTHSIAGQSNIRSVDISDCKLCASEITSHVMKFIEWFTGEESPVAILYGKQKERFATTDRDYTIEELYQRWFNSVKNETSTATK